MILKWFRNLKTSVKLISSFMMLAVVVTLVGVIGLRNMNTLNNQMTHMYDNNLNPIRYATDINISFQYLRLGIWEISTVEETSVKDEIRTKM